MKKLHFTILNNSDTFSTTQLFYALPWKRMPAWIRISFTALTTEAGDEDLHKPLPKEELLTAANSSQQPLVSQHFLHFAMTVHIYPKYLCLSYSFVFPVGLQ